MEYVWDMCGLWEIYGISMGYLWDMGGKVEL